MYIYLLLPISGVDPKSVFCAFFKQGLCKKGADKCKFSHDPDVERKSAKRSLYTDVDKDKENDNMEDWDDEKLAEVIGKKHGAEKTNETAIVRIVILFSYCGMISTIYFHPVTRLVNLENRRC